MNPICWTVKLRQGKYFDAPLFDTCNLFSGTLVNFTSFVCGRKTIGANESDTGASSMRTPKMPATKDKEWAKRVITFDYFWQDVHATHRFHTIFMPSLSALFRPHKPIKILNVLDWIFDFYDIFLTALATTALYNFLTRRQFPLSGKKRVMRIKERKNVFAYIHTKLLGVLIAT